MHLAHRAARANKPHLAARQYFRAGIVRIGGVEFSRVLCGDKQVLLVMHPAYIHRNRAGQRLIQDEVQDATQT